MRKILVALTLTASLALPGAASADTVTFSQGALIIPMESTFQPRGGMVSAYGLVYRILQANAAGHKNASHPVTVYIVNNTTKASPNRCVPSNLSTMVTSGTSTNTRTGLGTWNDGCDFSISNSSRQPVVPVDYSAAYTAGMIWPDAAVPTYTDSNAFPQFTQSAALTTANAFTTVNYLGAPFVIDAPDVPAVMDLIQNGDTGTNAVPKAAIDIFSDTEKSLSGHCTPSSLTTNTTTTSGVTISSGCHYVMMHQATASFSANVDRRINVAPKPFMLFEPGSSGIGQVLDNYLMIAGLWVYGTTNGADSRGCPVGNVTGCTWNSSSCTAGTECPTTSAVHGNIYDFVSDTDNQYQNTTTFPKGLVNYKVNGKLFYRLYWAPHWDGTTGDTTAVSNVVAFLNNPGTAMMSECASITLWENGAGGSKTSVSNTYGGPSNLANFIFTNGINVSSTVSGPNCSDPLVPSTSNCASYPNAGNVFSQVGDWMYISQGGSNPGYKALTGSTYQAWAKQMVTTSNGYDAFDMGQKDASHGVVIYVSGHNVSGDPNGSRVVLNSMLNLGGDPIGSDRDLAAPVVTLARSDSATAYPDTLLTGTYQAISGYSTNSAVQTFDPSSPGLWTYPYYPGNLRAHDLTALTAGETDYSTDVTWDGANVAMPDGISPVPSQRNLFTWLGGYPKSMASMPGGGSTPNGVLQWNWRPEAIDGTLLSSTCTALGTVTSGCVDAVGYSSIMSSPTYDDAESGLHLVVGSDGLCDLQEIINFSKLNSGSDWSGGDCEANNITKFLADAPNTALMLQRVRGYCYAGSLTALQPVDTACVTGSMANITNDNRAHLGGLVHGAPAVVGPSSNIADLGAKRPTVAFVGGYDGQLHAFYVGGGSGYKGPASTVSYAWDSDATPKFYKDWGGTSSTPFTPPDQGTELWSFLPASQLPHLQNNSAQVDSSPVVMDVFADFKGTGLREWHTILVESIGGNGDELFALDVTNPLRPRLLWDNVGTLFQTGSTPYYSATSLLNDSLTVSSGGVPSCTATGNNSNLPGSCVVPKWIEGTAKYLPKPLSDPGRVDTKVYDFQDLAGAAGLSLAQIRIGLEPYYVLFAATNMKAGSSGLEVFAIDVATGQKLWQWEHAYSDGTRDSANTVPSPPSIIYGENGASKILVGDMEGKVWELDALTGMNLRDLAACHGTSACNVALFDDGSVKSPPTNDQPISTNIAVAQVPANIGSGYALSSCAGATVLIFGTTGEDWISQPSNTAGKVHVVVYDNKGNASCPVGEAPSFPVAFAAGERVYGEITVAGAVAYVATAKGTMGTDIMSVSAQTGGRTYAIDLGTAKAGALSTGLAGSLATFGGMAVYAPSGNGAAPTGVIGSEVSKINVIGNSTLTPLKDSKVDSNLNQSKTSWTFQLRNWLERFIK